MNDRKPHRLALALVAALMTSALSMPAAEAQPIPGMSPKEKAAAEKKSAEEKANDRAYKSSLGNIPNAKKNDDPWGGVRTPSATEKK